MSEVNCPHTTPNAGPLWKFGLLAIVAPTKALTVALSGSILGRTVASWFRDFPVDPAEAMTPAGQKMLSRIITGKDGAVIEPYRCQGLDAEPLKQRTNLAVTVNGTPVFIKYSTARNLPLVLKALLCALESAPREIVIFRELAENEAAFSPAKFRIPRDRMIVPKLVASRSNMWQYSSLLAMEMIDQDKYVVMPEAAGIHVNLVRLVVLRAAEMHALNWQPPNTVLPEVFERSGLSFLSVVDLTKNNKRIDCNPEYCQVWAAMSAWAKKESAKPDGCLPMTAGHVDCRPGNMMFRKDIAKDPGSEASQKAVLEDGDAVVFCDWEAGTVQPWLWDAVYCMVCGLTTEDRHKHEMPIIKEYVRALATALRREPSKVAEAERIESMSDQTLRLIISLHKMGFYYWSCAITHVGMSGANHGNTARDMEAWTNRLRDCTKQAVDPTNGLAQVIGIPQEKLDHINAKMQVAPLVV